MCMRTDPLSVGCMGVNWQILLYVKLKGSQLVLSASCELVWSTVSIVAIWGG